jgi:hypothetical protein
MVALFDQVHSFIILMKAKGENTTHAKRANRAKRAKYSATGWN